MTYNLTGLAANSTGMLAYVQGINSVLVFGYLGIMLLVTVVLVALISFLLTTNDFGKSLAASSYIAFVLSILLRALNLIPNLALFLTLILAAGIIAITWPRS